MSQLPLQHAHDPQALIKRWRALAKQAGLRIKLLVEVDDEKIIYLQSRRRGSKPLIYLSTGVHGDEAGSAWGLLAWAERNAEQLQTGNFLIFPCINPHGLRANTRLDQRGLDINRRFHLDDDPLCGPWRELIRQKPPSIGICLHEDYDSAGCYVYELGHHPLPLGPALLQACTSVIPVDPRPRIDGRSAKAGLIRRSTVPPNLPGMPEAVVLWQLGCPLTLTFETPSELGLDARVQTHADFVSAVIRHTVPALHQP